MNFFTCTTFKGLFTALIVIISATSVFAEGSKQLAPGTPSLNAPALDTLATIQLKFNSIRGMAFPGAGDSSRLYFSISDHQTENIALGLSYKCNIAGIPLPNETLYYKVYDPNGAIIKSGGIGFGATPANLNTYDLVSKGPNLLGIGTGYDTTGFVINPKMNGNYYIEFMDDITDVNFDDLNSNFGVRYFDITVFSKESNFFKEHPGRLFSKRWYLRTDDTDYPNIPNIVNNFERPFAASIYVKDNTNAVALLDFRDSGFRGLGFHLSFNGEGPLSGGSIAQNRQSQTTRKLNSDYKVFVNPPDSLLYPPPSKDLIGSANYIFQDPCDSTSLCLEIVYEGAGQLRILLEFDVINGLYDLNTSDRLIELNVSSMNTLDTICIPFDKKDGAGNIRTLSDLEASSINVTFLQGLVHLQMDDVEYLSNGIEVKGYRPSRSFRPPTYWDDRLIFQAGFNPDTSGTSSANVEFNGCKANNCHNWNNFFFGNVHTINSWWTSYEVNFVNNDHDLQIQKESLLANDDFWVTDQNTPIDFNPLANDQTVLCSSFLDVSSVSVLIPTSNGNITLDTATGFGLYQPNDQYIGFDTFTYVICLSNGICDTAMDIIQIDPAVIPPPEVPFYIPNAFSPNGDIVNEDFFITGLEENYPNAELTIYNRWGDEIWSSDGKYLNNWTGTYKDNDENVPDGTYFYILYKDNSRSENFAGFVWVAR